MHGHAGCAAQLALPALEDALLHLLAVWCRREAQRLLPGVLGAGVEGGDVADVHAIGVEDLAVVAVDGPQADVGVGREHARRQLALTRALGHHPADDGDFGAAQLAELA